METVVGSACAQADEQQMLAGRVAEAVRTGVDRGMEMVTRVTEIKFESYSLRGSLPSSSDVLRLYWKLFGSDLAFLTLTMTAPRC